MAEHWAITDPADCDPAWTDWQPSDRTPTPFDLRQAEIADLRDQRAGLVDLYRAATIHAPEYL
ncbi:hypothetical protein [Streptomyces aurantiogriseus]|uniref:Uncharacterized protein n=1 Tax=Streptomyces aurantiogriseus TaxID=66870 RepID=A0A918FNW6_9ACTN|nr:hypothetical protein [Streptomyces aurantiogriseus]GGR61218.1 hypothetical protein GCM10010251_92450 [Streptomyces aurantiogriseus]